MEGKKCKENPLVKSPDLWYSATQAACKLNTCLQQVAANEYLIAYCLALPFFAQPYYISQCLTQWSQSLLEKTKVRYIDAESPTTDYVLHFY